MSTSGSQGSYQGSAVKWLLACFGETIACDKVERNHRFLEESLELVQACGASASEAHQIVDYVYGREVGQIGQEIGGVMNTLAALCSAHGFDMIAEGDREIERCWIKIEKIRAKQAAKPKHSPLPQQQGPSAQELLARIRAVEALADKATALARQRKDDIARARAEALREAIEVLRSQ